MTRLALVLIALCAGWFVAVLTEDDAPCLHCSDPDLHTDA